MLRNLLKSALALAMALDGVLYGASSHLFFSVRRYILDWLYCPEGFHLPVYHFDLTGQAVLVVCFHWSGHWLQLVLIHGGQVVQNLYIGQSVYAIIKVD